MSGPLAGTTVIELAGIGPAPFAGMMLADMGANVIRVARPNHRDVFSDDLADRGKRSIVVDLKRPEGVEVVLRLVEGADALIEGLRPGVLERLGVGPDACMAANRALVYGRVTGWGQEGPLAHAAGHDINYIAVGGVLGHVGPVGQKPVPPLNLVGDFGGGGMLLVVGVLSALVHARATGEGQVVDAAMIDGAALQITMARDLMARGLWTNERGTNLLDSGAPFYDTYETSDGRFMAVGAIEPQFFAALLDGLGIEQDRFHQMDRTAWSEMATMFAGLFATRTQAEWTEVFDGTDACVSPVLSMSEAPDHPHARARSAFIDDAGRAAPAPAPRFLGTPATEPTSAPAAGEHTDEVLAAAGFSDDEVGRLRAASVVG